VVKDESHPISVAIDSGYAGSEGRDQLVQACEQDVGQNGSFQMSPPSFDQIQARAVGWQPVDFDSIGIGCQSLPNRLRMMESAVIAHEANLAAGISFGQRDQENQEVHATLAVGERVRDLARRVVDSTVYHFFLVLAGRWDLRLCSHRRPYS
jgi:hypothetical protein